MTEIASDPITIPWYRCSIFCKTIALSTLVFHPSSLSLSPTHTSIPKCLLIFRPTVCVTWIRLGIVTHVSLKTRTQSWAPRESRHSLAHKHTHTKDIEREWEEGRMMVKATAESFCNVYESVLYVEACESHCTDTTCLSLTQHVCDCRIQKKARWEWIESE